MDLGEYARIYVATYGKSAAELDSVLRGFGRTKAWLDETTRHVDSRAAVDSKVAAEVNARVTLVSSALTRSPLPVPSVARHVRARRCFRCGAYKRTAPRTAHVFCDYCGSLFDYDEGFARQAAGGAAAPSVFQLLIEGTRGEIQRSHAAMDLAAYRAAWRWPYEMDMMLCPGSWSPRVGDPAYRKAMLDFSVETCVVNNFSDARRSARDRRDDARASAMDAPSDETFRQYLAGLYDFLSVELAEYQKAGLFAPHPDGLDGATYHHINFVLHVLDWSKLVSDRHFDTLLRLSKIKTETVTLHPVALQQASCARCGGHLLVAEGAARMICEACGYTLDCAHACPCVNCGAPLLLSAGVEQAKCAWCETITSSIA